MRVGRLLAWILILLVAAPAAAEERILHFLSDVRVQQDGTLDVTESIRVQVEGDQIRRGITRDFPTRYALPQGGRRTVGFQVLDVKRDGAPERYDRKSIDNGVQLRIGDPDVLLDPGTHVYTIRYRTTRQLGFFEDYDELYWNATGTGWVFPIDVAEARIRLPQPVPFIRYAFYTGAQGSSQRGARVISEAPGEILIRTTNPLPALAGLTLAVAFPKGVVQPPSESQEAGYWLQDYAPIAAAVAGLGLLLFFYYTAWRRAGRGPRAGPVVPTFTPPEGMSAAGVRYVSQMGFDDRAYAAAVVELGVKGRIKLVEEDGGFFSKDKTTIHEADRGAHLPRGEAAMASRLFKDGSSIRLENKNHKTFQEARSALSDALTEAYEGKLFLRNVHWALAGLLLFFMILVGVAVTIIAADTALGTQTLLPLLSLAAAVFGAYVLLLRRGKHGAAGIAALLLAILLIGGSFAMGVVAIGQAIETGRGLALLIPLIGFPVVLSAFWWMTAPTRKGRQVMDRIAGFKHYLAITEENRLNVLHPPEKTPELFERYLPYAIALEVENRWADKFRGVLAAAAATGSAGTMGWYSGDRNVWSDPGGFAKEVGSSLSSSIASAATAPGSSSGSGGGGFSGGGGGGGGGGGW